MHTEHSDVKPGASKTIILIIFAALALMTLTGWISRVLLWGMVSIPGLATLQCVLR